MNGIEVSYFDLHEETNLSDGDGKILSLRFQMPAEELLKIPNDRNVRGALPYLNDVKKAIIHTCEHRPEELADLHSGITVWARTFTRTRGGKIILPPECSIINGGQTQSAVNYVIKKQKSRGLAPGKMFLKVQLLITDDERKVADAAIARNHTVPVKDISKLGRMGLFDELNDSLHAYFGDTMTPFTLALHENHRGDNVIDTVQYLRYSQLMMPACLYGDGEFGTHKQLLFRQKARSRRNFVDIYHRRDSDPVAGRQYRFIRDFGPAAWDIATKLQKSEIWRGHRLMEKTGAIDRTSPDGSIRIADGLLMPTLAAITEFMTEGPDGTWYGPDMSFTEANAMVDAVVDQFRRYFRACHRDMGKNGLIYDTLRKAAADIREQRAVRRR